MKSFYCTSNTCNTRDKVVLLLCTYIVRSITFMKVQLPPINEDKLGAINLPPLGECPRLTGGRFWHTACIHNSWVHMVLLNLKIRSKS